MDGVFIVGHTCSGENLTCTNSIFSGEKSYCMAGERGGCAGSIFNGDKAYCSGSAQRACAGAIIQAGAYCNPYNAGGCDGALYGINSEKDSASLGCCDHSTRCPRGSPVCTYYASTGERIHEGRWQGNCCNPAYMASGECPEGVNVCS